MSEPTEEDLLSDNEIPTRQGETPAPKPKQDLVDTFELFKTYLDHKLVDLKSDIISEQESISLKVKDEVNLKFKSEGNKIQYRFNEEILASLSKLEKPNTFAATNSIIADLKSKVKNRNKLIRIADKSAGGWSTVREYESSDIADNSDDEKKIRQAETRALRTIKEKTRPRPTPYPRYAPPRAETAPNPYSDYTRRPIINQQPFRTGGARREPRPWEMCYFCKQFGHWKKDCPLNIRTTSINSNQLNNNPK